MQNASNSDPTKSVNSKQIHWIHHLPSVQHIINTEPFAPWPTCSLERYFQ